MIAFRAALWAQAAGQVSDTQKWGEQLALIRTLETHIFGAHMCVLAFVHLHSSLRVLAPCLGLDKDLVERARTFRRAYKEERIYDLRNRLEHEEEYLAGRHPRSFSGSFPVVHVTGYDGKTGRLESVRSLDTDYVISRTLAAAVALEEPFRALSVSLGK